MWGDYDQQGAQGRDVAEAMIALRPATRAESREAVRAWHSHHKPHVGEIVAIGATVGGRWSRSSSSVALLQLRSRAQGCSR